jgi:acyl carrier protein phosphodiesterase
MNYLGHIYLSGENEQLMTGNFIGDYVKGKGYLNYPAEIQRGILFHREIDHYTDQHPNWKIIRETIRPIYGRYAGVVADLFADHILAKNWAEFSEINLNWKSKWAYAVLLKHYNHLPPVVQSFLPYLIQHRRLQS